MTDHELGLFLNEFSVLLPSTSRITNKKGPQPTMTVNRGPILLKILVGASGFEPPTLGPEPNVYAPIPEGFLDFPTAGSNGVAIRGRPDPAFADHGGRVRRCPTGWRALGISVPQAYSANPAVLVGVSRP